MSRLRLVCGVLAAVVATILCGCGGDSEALVSSASTAPPVVADIVSPAQDEQLLGDMDDDGTAGVGDAIAVLRIVVGFDADEPYADADQDGMAGVSDAIKILRIVVGLDSTWPLAWEVAWVYGNVAVVVFDSESARFIDRWELDSPASLVECWAGDKHCRPDDSGNFWLKGVALGEQELRCEPLDDHWAVFRAPVSVIVAPPDTWIGTIWVARKDCVPPSTPDW